jgi:hypothetical protein
MNRGELGDRGLELGDDGVSGEIVEVVIGDHDGLAERSCGSVQLRPVGEGGEGAGSRGGSRGWRLRRDRDRGGQDTRTEDELTGELHAGLLSGVDGMDRL